MLSRGCRRKNKITSPLTHLSGGKKRRGFTPTKTVLLIGTTLREERIAAEPEMGDGNAIKERLLRVYGKRTEGRS